MNDDKCDKASRKYTIITVLGITALALLILVSIANAEKSADISDSESNDHADLNKYVEKNMKTQDIAIEINPQYSDAWTGKELALSQQNKFDKAAKAFDKAIEINPQNTDAWNNKGDALTKLNKSNEAKKAYDKAIEIDSQNSKLGAEDNNGE
jgi:tetratricopeptide (TPR) repeat protein